MAVFIHFTRSVEFLYKTPPAKLEIGLHYVWHGTVLGLHILTHDVDITSTVDLRTNMHTSRTFLSYRHASDISV